MRLHLYFARRFLMSFLAVFGALFLMLALFDLLEQVRRFGGEGVGLQGLLTLTFLNVPKSVYRIIPLITIIASIFCFLSLSRSSELVVSRASGRPALMALVGPVAVALLIGVVSVAFLNPIVAATLKQYEAVASDVRQSGVSTLSISQEGLWLRQGDEDGQTVIRASRANLNGTEMIGATFFAFDPSGTPVSRIEAARARLVVGAWELTDAKKWALGADNPEREAVVTETMTIPSDLTPDEILDSFGDPAAVPIWDLREFIARLETAGFSARIHRVWYQMEVSLPFLLAAMTLVGAGFTMRHTRFGKTSVMILLALGSGFLLFFIRNFAQILGENGQIPVLLAAWAPTAAALLLPISLILHLEDG